MSPRNCHRHIVAWLTLGILPSLAVAQDAHVIRSLPAQVGYSLSGRLELRSLPERSGQPKRTLNFGSSMCVDGKVDGWYRLRYFDARGRESALFAEAGRVSLELFEGARRATVSRVCSAPKITVTTRNDSTAPTVGLAIVYRDSVLLGLNRVRAAQALYFVDSARYASTLEKLREFSPIRLPNKMNVTWDSTSSNQILLRGSIPDRSGSVAMMCELLVTPEGPPGLPQCSGP